MCFPLLYCLSNGAANPAHAIGIAKDKSEDLHGCMSFLPHFAIPRIALPRAVCNEFLLPPIAGVTSCFGNHRRFIWFVVHWLDPQDASLALTSASHPWGSHLIHMTYDRILLPYLSCDVS